MPRGYPNNPAGARRTGPKPKAEAERFWPKVLKLPGDGCWLWMGHTNGAGYGMFRVGSQSDGTRRKVLAHRWAYKDAYGEEPANDGDHECHNRDRGCPGGKTCPHRRCVRPDHVEDHTRSENLRRSGRMGRY